MAPLDELRSNMVFHSCGDFGATLRPCPDHWSELEMWWRHDGWIACPTGVLGAPDDQLLPVRPGEILIRRGGRRQTTIIHVRTNRDRSSARSTHVAHLDEPDVRLLPPPSGMSTAVALVLVHSDDATDIGILRSDGSVGMLLRQVPGRFLDGHWLDDVGRFLLASRSLDGRPCTGVLIDLGDGSVKSVLDIGAQTNDRIVGFSRRSMMVVAHTDAGGVDRIGTATLPSGAFGFPERLSSERGMTLLAIDPRGAAVLVCERRGAVSALGRFEVAASTWARLRTPMGHLRGQAVWGAAGMSVPWSTPDLPHTVLEFGHDGTAVRPPTTTDDARAAVVAIPAGTHTLEGVVYGAADWRWAEKLLIALHGGPLSAWHFEFSPLFNQLVASGFVVLALNQRGSTGYGRRYAEAIRGAWGGPDLDDVIAVTTETSRLRAARGLGPPTLFGVSYGAFLALLATTLMPESVLACAALSPFSSAAALYDAGGPGARTVIDRLDGLARIDDDIGPRDVAQQRRDGMPPTFVVQGVDDDIVPVEQSRHIVGSLRAAQSEPSRISYLEVPATGHDLLGSRSGRLVRDEVCRFFDSTAGPRTPRPSVSAGHQGERR